MHKIVQTETGVHKIVQTETGVHKIVKTDTCVHEIIRTLLSESKDPLIHCCSASSGTSFNLNHEPS